MPDLVRVLESCPVSEVLDNVSVILQKLSSRPESRLRLAAEPRLIERLQRLANSTPGFYGGGGDVSTDGEPDERSTGSIVSEFLWLNVQSVLSHLK